MNYRLSGRITCIFLATVHINTIQSIRASFRRNVKTSRIASILRYYYYNRCNVRIFRCDVAVKESFRRSKNRGTHLSIGISEYLRSSNVVSSVIVYSRSIFREGCRKYELLISCQFFCLANLNRKSFRERRRVEGIDSREKERQRQTRIARGFRGRSGYGNR